MSYQTINYTTFDKRKKEYVFCGQVKNYVFTRYIDDDDYMFKERGYGIQQDVFKKLVLDKVSKVVLIKKGYYTFFSNIHDWYKFGIVRDYGSGNQVFLSIRHMVRG